MTNKRVTISVPEEIVAKAQRAVDSGQAGSVSAYFTELAENAPDWVAIRATLDELKAEVGEVSAEDRQWAREALGLDGADEFPGFEDNSHAAA
ncbi:hypothetical protein KIK06_17010 [Nocardiopsis sp. EMB25]|uniref:hypothetical protein n=1 Tax=Nocardiopsis sp. EMB25 TaxID=2835867 RepID=UPI002283E73D|nr:hypothetical protein [Nocardiopsis sp. EMB25]MCY9785588.1 hypothetical protein [Nocardiopsis sp. EMB25]